MKSGWIPDDVRATALWEAADRAFAIYRLYAEEMVARTLQEPSASAAERFTGNPPAGCSPE